MAVAYAFCGGISVNSVYPSLDEALIASEQKGFSVKREGKKGAVLNGRNPSEKDGDNGGFYITEIQIEPSSIHDGMWCQKGSEGTEEEGWEAFSYFSEEDWMTAQG
jgi:hypothetical protein